MTPLDPSAPFGSHVPPDNASTRERVNLPSIFLIASSALAISLALMAAIVSLVMNQIPVEWIDVISDDKMRDVLSQALDERNRNPLTGLLFPLWMIAGNAFIIWGALQMRQLKNYSVSVAAAVLATIPCCVSYCCCFFSMPIGIWALYVLLQPEVKARFS